MSALLLWALLILPILDAFICLFLQSRRSILIAALSGVFAIFGVATVAIGYVIHGQTLTTAHGWLMLDALSAFHLLVMTLIFSLTTLYAARYFLEDSENFTRRVARQFSSLWFAMIASILTVLLSNNLGIMWVGIEATTLVASLLISLYGHPLALEASWKYILLGVVGGTFAFIGTLTVGIATHRLPLSTTGCLMWTELMRDAALLNPEAMKISFIFLVIGYGTKVGLAPMHSWLPDAHSQAPAPVSAIFSGFLLNLSLYCILRYIPLVEVATQYSRWSLTIMILFGIISVVVAAAFILFQHDLKRLLAYSSIEHLGIITLGIGIGGLGMLAALFHSLNHAICKTVSFFCAGRLDQIYGTHKIDELHGVSRLQPLWGTGLFTGLLVLIGVAPFSIFMSEFQFVKAALDHRFYFTLAFFIVGALAVFVGALPHAMNMAWGIPSQAPKYKKPTLLDYFLVLFPVSLLLFLGLWMPDFLWKLIQEAALLVGK